MIILASASPRRAQLLGQLGHSFTVHAADINEDVLDFENPLEYVKRLSQQKAQAVAQQYANDVILAADTTVVASTSHGLQILGKPSSKTEAFAMWRLLGSAPHTVCTGVTIQHQSQIQTQVVQTQVYFKALSPQEMDWYWHTSEPQDKAGGYAIQGLAGQFVKQIQGSYSNVVGLPLYETAQMLKHFEI